MLKQTEGSHAVAEAIALSRPQVICAYPITPQTHIVEGLGEMVKDGSLTNCEYINVESEFAAMSVAIGASAAGVRSYTATSSQGLLFMAEAVYNASGLGLPIVMTVGNRAIGAPINIWNDHSDSMSMRDAGWIQLYAETNQEALDLHIQAFRIAEELSCPIRGRSVDEYRAPLFIAWQLTNRCRARCITCCEESGPDKAWRDELTRDEALKLARDIVAMGIPYAAFGGGEPLGVPHAWEIFEILAAGGVSIKLETEGSYIDDAAADRLADLRVQCVQISVDGATAATHERVRPGASFASATASLRRLAARGLKPQLVFVPTRFNLEEIVATYRLAGELGCDTFVTGPLMRLGRAAAQWEAIAPSPAEWDRAVQALRAAARPEVALAIYPWDILTEVRTRLESPQAMLLVVPNGKVKLLNALPFSPADLRRDSLAQAWAAYCAAWRTDEVRAFVARCDTEPELLRHCNETWPLDSAYHGASPPPSGGTTRQQLR